jgi:orotidine-5'-phosphate decarboxylase
MSRTDKLIIALDVPGIGEASTLVEKLSPLAGWFKIGSRLFTREGPRVCALVKESGARLFLDLKFHDIPNTVYGAVSSALELGADMMTLHASGGVAMMRAAVRAVEAAGADGVTLVGVTVLTHFELGEFLRLFSSTSSQEGIVIDLAAAARESGLDGVVASAQELPLLKGRFGSSFTVVTPGIRLAGEGGADDQTRIVTPEQAVGGGADYIVVGRPIIAAPDPVAACRLFCEKIRSVSMRPS